uniref:Putative peptidase YuxL n=1 Tax=Thermosporothrix sp. COM3 TaxID=2490863 RepID=A0A455SIH5_9CHLR|nr:putative peptidase YuxL [Thermosporothrix sp. COM3]
MATNEDTTKPRVSIPETEQQNTEQHQPESAEPENTGQQPLEPDDNVTAPMDFHEQLAPTPITPEEPASEAEAEPTPVAEEHEQTPNTEEKNEAPEQTPNTREKNEAPELTASSQQPAGTIVTPAREAPVTAPRLPYMRVEDLTELRVVSDPQLSPDGSQIAFTVLESDAVHNTTRSAIWLVKSNASKNDQPWKLTTGTAHDTQPRWSPDGRRLAFLSDRSGTPQIYVLTMYGGEAQQLSDLPQGVSDFSWSPNGRAILAQSGWKPADEQNLEQPGYAPTIITRLGAYREGTGFLHGRHQQLWLLPLAGEPTRITSEPVDLLDASWSPDGSEIAFCANRRTDADISASSALWVLTLKTGQLRRLSPEDGVAAMPAWSPDGKYIAFLYSPDQTEASNIAPWLVEADGSGTARPAVPGAEAITTQVWIIDELRTDYLTRPQWYPDSQSFIVTVQERGQVHLSRINLVKQSIERLTKGNGRYLAPQLSQDGQRIALIRADWFTPGDIWCTDGNGENLRKLTRVNDAFLQSRQLIRPKRVTWKAHDGLEIEGWLYLPPLRPGTRAPLLLAPHGGPTAAWGDAYVHEFQVLAGRGYAVLAPNSRGSSGYGEEFSRKLLNDWGGDDYRDLMAGLDHVLSTEPLDSSRLGITGMSYGGYMTNWAIAQTNRFKAAVSRNSISNIMTAGLLSDQPTWFQQVMDTPDLQRSRSPLTHAHKIQTPLLLLHGENDLRCPISEAVQLFTALRQRKRVVQLVRYPEGGHLMDWPANGSPQLRLDRLRRTVEWFEHFV